MLWLGIRLAISLVAAALAISDLRKLSKAHRSRGWPTVQGQMIHSAIPLSGHDDDGTSYYELLVEYTYTAGGREYHGGPGIAFGFSTEQMSHSRAQKLLHRVAGKGLTVYYNPDRPQEATLLTGASWKMPLVIVAEFAVAVAVLTLPPT